MQQQPPPAAAEQQGAQGQGQGVSMDELVNGTAAALTAVAQKMQQAGASPEQMKAMVQVMNQFGSIVQQLQGGAGKEASQTVSPEGGVQGQPMSPAGV